MRINSNIPALKASNNLTRVNKLKTSNLEKLSSGLRINKASDDAAGLAISEKMRGQITGMKQAIRNSSDGQALIQTAEGSLGEATSILQRMRELSVQAANETNSADERGNIKSELDQLTAQLDVIASDTKFNGKDLLSTAGAATPISLQIGANSGENMSIQTIDLEAANTTLKAAVKVDTTANIDLMVTAIDTAIKSVSDSRATLGAQVNRLDYSINSLNTSLENLTDAESRIRDVDMASEMVQFSKNNILSQSGTAMLAQANSMPQGILQLLQ